MNEWKPNCWLGFQNSHYFKHTEHLGDVPDKQTWCTPATLQDLMLKPWCQNKPLESKLKGWKQVVVLGSDFCCKMYLERGTKHQSVKQLLSCFKLLALNIYSNLENETCISSHDLLVFSIALPILVSPAQHARDARIKKKNKKSDSDPKAKFKSFFWGEAITFIHVIIRHQTVQLPPGQRVFCLFSFFL